MQINFDEISKNLLDIQASKIPEPYRSKFLEIIQKLQTDLQFKLYPGRSKTGLVDLVIDHNGILQKTHIDKSLFDEYTDIQELNENISESLVSAHKLAIKNAKQDLDLKLKQLYEEMLKLKKEINETKSNKYHNRIS
jgi:DNA-binding protein YbaB